MCKQGHPASHVLSPNLFPHSYPGSQKIRLEFSRVTLAEQSLKS